MGRPVSIRSARLNVERAVAAIMQRSETCVEPFGAFVDRGSVQTWAVSSKIFARLTSTVHGPCRTLIGTYTYGIAPDQVREDVEACLASMGVSRDADR